MATRTSSLAPTNNSDANFRLWINEIHNSLIAFGWVQGSDSGQINFSTVTAPSGGGNFPGFAIYRMADSLQSACPVYMRLDFGESGSSADVPAIKIQLTIGSTDGAGTLTGTKSTLVTTTTSSAIASATLFSCYTCGTTSSFYLSFWGSNPGTLGFSFMIDRERNVAGAETSNGINLCIHYNGAGNATFKLSQFLENTTGNVGAQDTLWYALVSNQTTQAAGGVVGVGHVRCELGPLRKPMLGLFVCARGDFTMGNTYPVTIYGASHTYIVLRPNAGTGSTLLNGVNTDSAFGMLFE
jgi:hypothetical protein